VWVPRSESELVEVIQAEELAETATFDAKVALPKKGKSKDLAIDVAAMANDGGTLLYGVDEDEQGRPIVPSPIDLSGAAERVDRIVRSCISEPPTVEIHSIPTAENPAVGYLVVAVPPSPRAPHMVTVDKEHRYYGRSATGNVRLSEGEVARLYERRRSWEVDREVILNEAIARAPLEPRDDFAYLHLVARPVVPDEGLLDRAKGDQHVAQFLNSLFTVAVSEEVFSRSNAKSYYPDLSEDNTFDRRSDGWVTSQGLGVEWQNYEDPKLVLEFEIGLDGSARLFCGRAADRDRGGLLLILEDLVAGLTARFLCVLGSLYASGSYHGPADVGLAVTGLRGGITYALRNHPRFQFSPSPFDKDKYSRTGRFMASMLKNDPRGCARKLVLPLAQATTQELYDPFAQG